ncbi:MAG TPA: FAD-binding oxidoreductase [Dehalococcoidia bacterium]|nr:FAD-binding oxidoreductase [Dehalococcoidia bacterium]
MTTMVSIEPLAETCRGQVITEDHADYDAARAVHNGMIDKRPLAVVRCADAGDVIATVKFARESGLPLSVRGGGHSAPGFGTNDGGVVADLSPMRWVRVDARNQTARAGGGTTWGDFNHATYPYGLATTGGVVSTTGIAGLTLGGGIGYLARKYGLSCDNLISADVVTADGRTLVASEQENADLFWAIRGGGGNFGVVTSFEYKMHPVRDITAGIFFFPLDRGADVLKFYAEYVHTAPRELGLFPAFQVAPPLPFIAEKDHGRTFAAIIACWAGAPEQAESVFAPIRDVAPIVAEMVAPMPYFAINALFDALLPAGLQQYWKASYAVELNAGAIAAHLEHGAQSPTMNTAVHIYAINGAVHDVAPDATAFAYREANFATVIAGIWPDPADNERNIAWARGYYKALEPHSLSGGYVNFMGEDDGDKVRANYRQNYDRLVSIKREYDPENLFRMNQNINPRSVGGL